MNIIKIIIVVLAWQVVVEETVKPANFHRAHLEVLRVYIGQKYIVFNWILEI